MKSRISPLLALLVSAPLLFAQAPLEVRNVEIDSQSPEGAILTQAGIAEEAAERIDILEGFRAEYPESSYLGYVLLQLQGLYTQTERWPEAAQIGALLLKHAPEDLEVRHNQNQALLNSKQWPELLASLAVTKPLADKEASAPPPDDPTEDEEMLYESSVDYAKGVVQYTEWALNAGMTQSVPAQQVQFMDKLVELYPESQYAARIDDKYVIAYQQAGDVAGMVGAMERSLAKNPGNEQYLFTLAEIALNQKDYAQVEARSEQLIQLMAEKPAPDGISGEAWDATKRRFTALGHNVVGTGYFQRGSWRTARRHLLQAADAIKAEGGERYGILAYMLGFCYVKLDIAGDNIAQATRWMGEAARVPNPMQAQAAKTLAAIQAAQ